MCWLTEYPVVRLVFYCLSITHIFLAPPLTKCIVARLSTRYRIQKTETSPKWFFWDVSCFFFKIYRKSLKSNFYMNFPFFLSVSLIFRTDSSLYRSYIFEGFPNIFDSFPHFWGLFPVFRKSFKFSVCWSVSPYILWVRTSTFFGSVSGFQKNVSILSLLIGFLCFWVHILTPGRRSLIMWRVVYWRDCKRNLNSWPTGVSALNVSCVWFHVKKTLSGQKNHHFNCIVI